MKRLKYNDESAVKENVKLPSFVSSTVKIESVDSNLILSNIGLIIWPEMLIWFKFVFDEFKHPIKNKAKRSNKN